MRIQGQGKVKDVGLKALATMPALEELDAKIVLIQALIPLGLRIAETLTAEVTALTVSLRPSLARLIDIHDLPPYNRLYAKGPGRPKRVLLSGRRPL